MNSNTASQPWAAKTVPHPGEPPSAISPLADKTRYAARLDAHVAFLMSKTALDSFERTTLAKAIVEALKNEGFI
jgi:hypothetical protein